MNDNEQSRKQSHMIQSPTVMKQQNELESQSLKTDIKSKKGSTNEIQAMETEDGLTQ